jgi:hypothetical protein
MNAHAFKDCAKRWAKCENENLDTLCEWVKSISGIFLIPSKKTLNLKYVPSSIMGLVNQM